LGTSGLRDWKIQRLSAVILALYGAYLFLMAWGHTTDFESWVLVFEHPSVRASTIVALFALLFHAWIGVWTITTDYLKATAVRLLVQGLVVCLLGGYGLWGFMIVEGMV
jgi:succinate dehydrogenase / fumarate reductase membrane anchor subunit